MTTAIGCPTSRPIPRSDAGPSCFPDQASCDGRCVTLESDSRHCGECGRACGPNAFCMEGECTASCPTPLAACDGACVDLASEDAHCGDCATSCASDFECILGHCACRDGLEDCDGVCVALDSPENCGRCGRTCSADEICRERTCAPAATEQDCHDGEDDDGDDATDCEDEDCFGATRPCECPKGIVSEDPREECIEGSWSVCFPCPPP
jgi:hypothetical protein